MLRSMSKNKLSPADAVALVPALAANASLTSLDVGWNSITDDGAQALADVVLDKQSLQSFCNIPLQQLRTDSLTELDLQGKGIGVPGALVLAHFLRVTASMTRLDVRWNRLGEEGMALLRQSIEGRSGFELML